MSCFPKPSFVATSTRTRLPRVPETSDTSDARLRSGFVALVGRPNSGKSTLVNALVGSKVAITSDTPQTTRHRLRAVVDRDDVQMVLVDTPGLHKPHDALGEELNRSALKALEDVDVVAMLVDATKPIGRGDEWVAGHVSRSGGMKVLVLSKADAASAEQVDAQLEAGRALADFDHAVVLSAKEGFNLEGFVVTAGEGLPEGPRWFPRDMPTDQPFEVMIAEFIREKILRSTFDEVPHAVGVALDDVAGWGAMLAQALAETGGPLSADERAWADDALGVPRRRRRSVA